MQSLSLCFCLRMKNSSYLLRQTGTGPQNVLRLAKGRGQLTNICNIIGQKVRTLVDGLQNAGRKTITWDRTDETGGRNYTES